MITKKGRREISIKDFFCLNFLKIELFKKFLTLLHEVMLKIEYDNSSTK